MDTPVNVLPPMPPESGAPVPVGQARTLKISIAAVLLFLALIGVALGGYYYYTQSSVSAEETVKRAMINMATAPSFSFDGLVKQHLEFKDVSDKELALYLPNLNADINVDGAFNIKDEKNPRVSMHGKGKAEYDMGGFTVSFSGDIAYIFTDNKAYIKFDVPKLMAMIIGDVQGGWIVIDEEFLDELDFPVAEEKDSSLVTAMQKFKKRFAEQLVFSKVEPLESERIDGVSTQRYRLTIDKKMASTLLSDMLAKYPLVFSKEEKRQLEVFLEGFTFETLDVWVDKREFLVRKVVGRMKGEWQMGDLESPSERRYREAYGGTPMDGTAIYTMDIDMQYKKIGEDIAIEKPAGAKTLEGFMKEAENSSNPGALILARRKGTDAAIKGNLAGTRTMAELYYDDHGGYGTKAVAAGPCPHSGAVVNTIFHDEDIATALDAVELDAKQRPRCALIPGVHGSWAISAPLQAERGYYWCVDSEGTSRKTKEILRSTKCPAAASSTR